MTGNLYQYSCQVISVNWLTEKSTNCFCSLECWIDFELLAFFQLWWSNILFLFPRNRWFSQQEVVARYDTLNNNRKLLCSVPIVDVEVRIRFKAGTLWYMWHNLPHPVNTWEDLQYVSVAVSVISKSECCLWDFPGDAKNMCGEMY